MLEEEIRRLKEEKRAVILAHYYVEDEVQKIADYIGDSYYLSKVASKTDADIIVFCGVAFMGESAAVLNPDKKVLMPDEKADCPMAHMIDIRRIEELRSKYPDLAVVCYINSTAKAKAHADVCVTSANAVKIVKELPNEHIYFIPDGNLGRYVAEQVPDKQVILHDGCCPVHAAITLEDVKKAKKEHPNAKFLAHPECPKEVLDEADYIGSTSGIIQFATSDSAQEYIIGTEIGVFYELRTRNPKKHFYPLSQKPVCMDMKSISLEKVRDVLRDENHQVVVSDKMREEALAPLEQMLRLAK